MSTYTYDFLYIAFFSFLFAAGGETVGGDDDGAGLQLSPHATPCTDNRRPSSHRPTPCPHLRHRCHRPPEQALVERKRPVRKSRSPTPDRERPQRGQLPPHGGHRRQDPRQLQRIPRRGNDDGRQGRSKTTTATKHPRITGRHTASPTR